MSRALIRIGVIGCGRVAQAVHLPILQQFRDVQIVALADPVAAARQAASRYAPAARLDDNPRDPIDDQRVEAVVICTPPASHAELATRVLNAGKHVYIEKPIATSLDQVPPLVEAWRNSETVDMVGFNYRQHPGYAAMRRAIHEGRIGEVVFVRTTFCTVPGQMDGWRNQRAAGGGVLMEFASHDVDLVRFVLGQPLIEVAAKVYSRQSEDDTALLEARSANGVDVQGFCSFSAIEAAEMEVYGQRGKLSVDRYGGLRMECRGAAAIGPVSRTLNAIRQWRGIGYQFRRVRSPWREPSFAANLARFIWAIRTGTATRPDVSDGLHSLAVIAAAEASAKSGRVETVIVPEGSEIG